MIRIMLYGLREVLHSFLEKTEQTYIRYDLLVFSLSNVLHIENHFNKKFACFLKTGVYLTVFQKSTKVVMSTDMIWSQPVNKKKRHGFCYLI